jgi:rubrerythrin
MPDTTTTMAPGLEHVEVEGSTRAAFLTKGAIASSAVFGLGAVSPFVSHALAAGGGGDLDILNFALTLEYLESSFYAQAQRKVKLSRRVRRLASVFGEEEAEHVKALTTAIRGAGGKPVKAPRVHFPFSNEKAFLALAATLEDTGVAAYNGAAPMLRSKKILGAAGSIVQVEARHAAAIRLAAHKVPAPNAFDPTLTKRQVLAAVKPFVTA